MTGNMKSDHFYAEMLGMMREQGKKDNPSTLQIGIMQSPNSVKIDDLILNAEDLYIADYLLAGYEYPLSTPYVDSVTYANYNISVTTKDKAIKSSGLKKGDLVTVQRLSNNMYVILAKVVRVT